MQVMLQSGYQPAHGQTHAIALLKIPACLIGAQQCQLLVSYTTAELGSGLSFGGKMAAGVTVEASAVVEIVVSTTSVPPSQ